MLPPGQEELLRRILDPPEGMPDGWVFERASVGEAGVEAHYRNGAARALVRLVHVRDAHAGALIVGNLALEGASELPEILVRTIEVSLLAREHRVEWRDPDADRPARRCDDPDVDPEWCALSAGVKTVLRISTEPDRAEATRQKYQSLGAVVVALETTAELDRHERAILYVSRIGSDAQRARELERPLLAEGASMAERRQLSEELGWALGYPSCCVEAFVERTHPSSAGLVGSYLAGNVGTEAYRAARDAWVARPAPRLNPFLRRVRRSLVSFEPCRYDCAQALAYADRVAGACALANREWLAETDRALARPLVIAPSGAWAIVRLERRIEPMRILEAEALAVPGQSPNTADEELAQRLLGAEAPEEGLFTRSGLGWCLLVDFGWRGERGS